MSAAFNELTDIISGVELKGKNVVETVESIKNTIKNVLLKNKPKNKTKNDDKDSDVFETDVQPEQEGVVTETNEEKPKASEKRSIK